MITRRFSLRSVTIAASSGPPSSSASAVKRSHKDSRPHYAYTGKFTRVDFYIGEAETQEDRMDAIAQHAERE